MSRNASMKMRNIVETIQKEPDAVIRDTDNELLIVQGVAGSGKTSIAMHRITFLINNGLNMGLKADNILIVSPNTVFGKYISSVLPELGEENVGQIVFEDYIADILQKKARVESRKQQFEFVSGVDCTHDVKLKRHCIEFKGSGLFSEILERFTTYYEHHMIAFEDIYYDGRIVETRQNLKILFLDNKIGMPAAKRLKRIENIILDKIHPMQRKRAEKIQKLVQKMDGHELEIKQYSRLLSIKESKAFLKRLKKLPR